MLYFLTRAIDYLHQASCAQSPAVGATIASLDLGFISAACQWLVLLLGAVICVTWPGVSTGRGVWRAGLFIVTGFCLSVVLSVWYEADVAETCVRPGVAVQYEMHEIPIAIIAASHI